MASAETPPLSIRHGIRIVPPEPQVTVEEVLLAVAEQIGHEKLQFASRMNKAVVVFVKEERLVNEMVEKGIVIRGIFYCGFAAVSSLSKNYGVWCTAVHPQRVVGK